LLEGEMFGVDHDRSKAYDDTVVFLSMDQLKARLANVAPSAYYPLLEEMYLKIGRSRRNPFTTEN
jgi:hypothetical protein